TFSLSPPNSEAIPMSSERPEEFEPPASREPPTSDARHELSDTTHHEATVLVRGETIHEPEPTSPPKGSAPKVKEKTARKEVSEAKIKMQSRLPALGDDPDVGVQKEHTVIRDG